MRKQLKWNRIVAVATLSVLAGCASFSTMKTARAIDPGKLEIMASGAALGTTVPVATACPKPVGQRTPDSVSTPYGCTSTQTQVEPQFEISARYGLLSRVDIGVKCWGGGCELSSTISLLRGQRYDLALAPSVGAMGYSFSYADDLFNANVVEGFVKLPVLFGWRFGASAQNELVVGPEIIPVFVNYSISPEQQGTYQQQGGDSVSHAGALLGGLVGVSLRVAPWLRAMPELTIVAPVAPFSAPSDQVVRLYGTSGAVTYQLGIGLAWGDDGLDGFGGP